MLRVGLTGGLGSGKSTAAKLFAALGAHVLAADEIARAQMQPGEAVYGAIAATFGPAVLLPDGQLDRAALARIAFTEGRVDALNAIVHPATIARQAELAGAIFSTDPEAIVIVESALILETKYSETKYSETKYSETKYSAAKSGGADSCQPQQGEATQPVAPASESASTRTWRDRFDKLILVTASEDIRIRRFIARSSVGRTLTEAEHAQLEAEAHRRIAQQWTDDRKAALSDYVLTNSGALTELEWQIDQLWPLLISASSMQKP